MRKTIFVLIACLLTLGVIQELPLRVYASQIPQLFTYEGKYVSPDNTPMPEGIYDLVFSLYEVQSGGSAIWTEVHRRADGNGVQVTKGKFKVVLGKNTPLPHFSSNYWLAIVDPKSGKEMVDREQLSSTPYALNGVPQGAIIIWRGETCPVGYKRVGAFDGRFLRGTNFDEVVGAKGGNETANHEILGGNHHHDFEGNTGDTLSNYSDQREGDKSRDCANDHHYHNFSGSTDTGSITGENDGLHTHPFPPYINVIFCEKE